MLLDTRAGLRKLHLEFSQYLESSESEHTFHAQTNGSSEPYKEFLCGLRVQKNDKISHLQLSADKWLELSGGASELIKFRDKLLIEEDGAHVHWYSTPISLIIEADDDWPSENES